MFFTTTLGLSVREISDFETLMLEHGIAKSAKEELCDLQEHLNTKYSAKVNRLFNKALIERLQNASFSQSFIFSQCDEINRPPTEPAKKTSKMDKSLDEKDVDFAKRHGLSKLSGPVKIATILQIQTEIETMNHSDLVDKMQSFVRHSLKPFVKHFNCCCHTTQAPC